MNHPEKLRPWIFIGAVQGDGRMIQCGKKPRVQRHPLELASFENHEGSLCL